MTDETVGTQQDDALARLAERFTPDRLAASCARTCLFAHCTGKGDRQSYAHRCRHHPDVVLDLGLCSCGEPATVQLMNRRSCRSCAPPQPTKGYCAPNRCYCRGVSCQRIPTGQDDNPEA